MCEPLRDSRHLRLKVILKAGISQNAKCFIICAKRMCWGEPDSLPRAKVCEKYPNYLLFSILAKKPSGHRKKRQMAPWNTASSLLTQVQYTFLYKSQPGKFLFDWSEKKRNQYLSYTPLQLYTCMEALLGLGELLERKLRLSNGYACESVSYDCSLLSKIYSMFNTVKLTLKRNLFFLL